MKSCFSNIVFPPPRSPSSQELMIIFFSIQKSQTERHKSSDESIASSIVPQDPRRDRKFSKQRSFGFSRQSQAPSEVSVNLTPDRTSIANLDDLGVS